MLTCYIKDIFSSVCDPQTLLVPLSTGLSWSAMTVATEGLGSFSFDGGSVTYDGVSLGSTATYTTSMDFRLNGSPEPFQSVCVNNEWTPLPNITSSGEVEVILCISYNNYTGCPCIYPEIAPHIASLQCVE